MCRNLEANTGYNLLSKKEREETMFIWGSPPPQQGLKESKSFVFCCFCNTTSSFNPSLEERGISPPQRGPQGTESPEHLQTWYDMEPADHLAAEQSPSPWKRGKNIYWFLSWELSLQNTETVEDSPYQQSPNGDHLHSDLHRRKRHEGLLPTNKRILEVKKGCFTKGNHRKNNSAQEHPLFINNFSEHLCHTRNSQNDFQAVLYSGLAGCWNMSAQMLFFNIPSD